MIKSITIGNSLAFIFIALVLKAVVANAQDAAAPRTRSIGLAEIEGRIVVAGHTDNIPIRTARFRSNWDLSAARAVTVVHRLTEQNGLDEGRFLIEGHADTEPLVANDSAANRALNRRVELTIMQGEQAASEPVAVIEFGDEQSDAKSLKTMPAPRKSLL